MTGDVLIGVGRSSGFFGWAIRKLTGSRVNHAYILYRSMQWGGWWAVQVDEKGVRILPSGMLQEKYSGTEVYSYDQPLASYLCNMRNTIGESYDYAGILGFFLKIVAWKVAHKKLRNALHRKDDLFCSEFVAEFLRRAGVPGAVDTLISATTSPGDILDFVSNPDNGFTRAGWPGGF